VIFGFDIFQANSSDERVDGCAWVVVPGWVRKFGCA